MSADWDQLLLKGLGQLESGNRRGAAQVFVDLLRQDSQIEAAWWWLSACVDTEQQKRDCLQRVLELNPWNVEARNALDQLDFSLPDPLPLAQSAEELHDYEAAYQNYSQALELNIARTEAWFGKGFCAGMLSTPARNGVREFFECIGKGLRSTGFVTSDLRSISVAQLTERLNPGMVLKLSTYLHMLFDYITGLADRCPPDMANIYHVERVYLADWIHFTQRLTPINEEQSFSREKMLFIAADAYAQIAANVRKSTRGAVARREMLENFKLFVMSNLALSRLNQDAKFISRVNEIIALNA